MSMPRVVIVTRRSELDELLHRHGTREQARFFLRTRGLEMEPVEIRHRRLESALAAVQGALPHRWRRARLDRDDLSRFVFEPGDVVVAVGQDGLVANAAKYLDGQPVIGINPDPEQYEGILVPHPAAAAGDLMADAVAGRCRCQQRTMVEARLDDGQRLLALNEIFLGHRSHQSARYTVQWHGEEERHSSSGLIVTTGTGATGWACSIHRQRRTQIALPGPEERHLAFFVREPFPSVATGTQLTEGEVGERETLAIRSEMNQGGVLFGDGIEADPLEFGWGLTVQLALAEERLRLVI